MDLPKRDGGTEVPIKLSLSFTAVCCHEPDDCEAERTISRLLGPDLLTVSVGAFRHDVRVDLCGAGWTGDAEGGWLCPVHTRPE